MKNNKLLTAFSATVILFMAMFTATPTNLHAERIVTLAPALTEIVFQLDKGENIVGNTKYCNFPEDAKKIPRLGGYLDINLELLIASKPDVIILYPELHEKLKILKSKAKLIVVKHTCLNDIYNGIDSIAKALKVPEKGKNLIKNIKKQLTRVQQKAAGKPKVKTLLIIGRNPDNMTNMFIIGAGDFLNELIEIAGGKNAYEGNIKYPSISVESIAAMNPDVIIELSAYNEGIKDQKVLTAWKKFPFISAVKKNKITIAKDSFWLIPGPRVPQIAKKMQKLFY